MSSAFSIDFIEPTAEFQTPVTFLLVDKNTKCGYSFSKQDRKEHFGTKIMVSVLAIIVNYATSSLI